MSPKTLYTFENKYINNPRKRENIVKKRGKIQMLDNEFKLSVELNKGYNKAINQLKADTGRTKKQLLIEFIEDGLKKHNITVELVK